jgi:putative PEP-CTERM system histidine kinase
MTYHDSGNELALTNLGIVSHSLAAVAFLVLLALVLISWRRGGVGGWLVVASAMTALWAAGVAFEYWAGEGRYRIVAVFEVLRMVSWLAFLSSVLWLSRQGAPFSRSRAAIIAVTVLISLVVIGLDLSGTRSLPFISSHLDMATFGRLVLAVTGLLVVENLFRNVPFEHQWGIKYLCFGIGGLFAYEFFMYSDALLFSTVDNELFLARGIINALVAPMVAIAARRNPNWAIDLFVSRQVVFHSASLIGAGGYLLLMAGAGFYIRRFGGEWGNVLQVVFLFAAALTLLLVIFSGAFRAKMKGAISNHFFRYKYDYRNEWLRFIKTISSAGDGGGLAYRIMTGIGDIVESPQGAVWLCEDSDKAVPLESWNLNTPDGVQTVGPEFYKFLEHHQSVINLSIANTRPGDYPGLVLPEWLGNIQRGWLIVPLLHHDRLFGFMLLAQPRAAREVDQEDYVLLTTVGRQAASYLAERQSARALAESRQFDEFNRRFAFVLHDIKNLVSQLSLVVQNADKHKANPAFQEDMLQTVSESVDKMNNLLVRLHAGGKEAAATTTLELESFLAGVVGRNARTDADLSFVAKTGGIFIAVDEERFAAVIAHLVDNALDAVAATDGVDHKGEVVVELIPRGADAVIEVRDNGMGMDEKFIRNELFKPFRSNKSDGYGIGAFESREFVKELGGRLDVSSRKGEGTTVTITLPAIGNDRLELKTELDVGAL